MPRCQWRLTLVFSLTISDRGVRCVCRAVNYCGQKGAARITCEMTVCSSLITFSDLGGRSLFGHECFCQAIDRRRLRPKTEPSSYAEMILHKKEECCFRTNWNFNAIVYKMTAQILRSFSSGKENTTSSYLVECGAHWPISNVQFIILKRELGAGSPEGGDTASITVRYGVNGVRRCDSPPPRISALLQPLRAAYTGVLRQNVTGFHWLRLLLI